MTITRRFPPNWQDALANVEDWIAHAMQVTRQREEALAALQEASSTAIPDIDGAAGRCAKLNNLPSAASAGMAPIDAELRAGEEHLRQWIDKADAARRRLATCSDRA